MSALTDLFTALANKIRSKTGGSDTYTPPQMVNAIDDVYDAGVAAGTTPTQTKTVTAGTSATTVTADQGYALSSVTVNPTPSQTKSSAPNVSTNKDVTPDSGYLLSKVTITPLSHTGTYTPAANTAANDMGANHDKRYVNTSGMIVPSGNKSITANGTGIDVSSYATASVNVPNPTLSGDAAVGDVLSGKTFYNSTYTKQTGTMTNRGAVSQTLNCGESYTVPSGYHNGSGTVTANSLASQTGVDSGKTAIDASHVVSGYQGWVNGSKISGSYNLPSGTYSAGTYTTNGTKTISGLSAYAAAQFTINVPTSSIVASGDTFNIAGSSNVQTVRICNHLTGTYYAVRSRTGYTKTWTYDVLTLDFKFASSGSIQMYAQQTSQKYQIKYIGVPTVTDSTAAVPTVTPTTFTPTSTRTQVATNSYMYGVYFVVVPI